MQLLNIIVCSISKLNNNIKNMQNEHFLKLFLFIIMLLISYFLYSYHSHCNFKATQNNATFTSICVFIRMSLGSDYSILNLGGRVNTTRFRVEYIK